MKKFLLIAVLGFAFSINNVSAQTSKKTSTKKTETKKKSSNSTDARHEQAKEDMRAFGRSQRDFWKGVHDRHEANKKAETKQSSRKGETKREAPPKPFKKKKDADKEE